MKRTIFLDEIERQLRVHPMCAVLGPRQVGKTTLANLYAEQYFPGKTLFLDLENPLDLQRLENPILTLSSAEQPLIVIDEIQRRPELFPILRVLVDREEKKGRKWLILGSASRDLIRQSSETLAGRIGYIELHPFCLFEVPNSAPLWLRGGFPRSYLAASDADSLLWRQGYITTFLERDIPNLGFAIPPQQLQRFWLMLAHYHGQIFNASELARSLAISDHTVRRYLDILAGTFMVRILFPWFENLKKRQVKSPKIYFRDSGVLHALVGINDSTQLQAYPRLGAFWEGFALEQIICASGASAQECYFWATQADAELDLLIVKDNRRIGIEFKYADAPRVTKSMHVAQQNLKLDHLIVVYPGTQIFPLTESITAYGLQALTSSTLTDLHRLMHA
jgi:predicted AAA+ superfamily ATPase